MRCHSYRPRLLFSDIELEVLSAYAPTLARPTPPPKTLAEAVRLTAIVGGYLARNNDGPPGHELMWSGFARLSGMSLGFALRKNMT